MAKKATGVPRPLKSTEYSIALVTSQAAKGWTDLVATQKNAITDAWDRLTKEPARSDPRCHQLKGELATVTHAGATHEQWQYELAGGARLWFYVEGHVVNIIRVFTAHPNQTK